MRTLAAVAMLTVVVSSAGARADAVKNAEPQSIQPAELAKFLRSPKNKKPLLIQVGFRVLYEQAHIPGSEYIGPASEDEALGRLRARVKALPRSTFIVLYCGCCPWSKCPNVKPAYAALRALGFKNVKVLRLADNFGADWVDKGYPVAKGR
ncbi:MAG: rhodanese-like domain-containing protein [Elusimicrobia bacterium]|nr:rhodanese-like domain-containing protein [Elusimicrobiota bacterium]